MRKVLIFLLPVFPLLVAFMVGLAAPPTLRAQPSPVPEVPKVQIPGEALVVVTTFRPNAADAEPATALSGGIVRNTITRQGQLSRCEVETWDGRTTEVWAIRDWVLYRAPSWKPGKYLPLEATDPLATPYLAPFNDFADLLTPAAFQGGTRLGSTPAHLFTLGERSVWLDEATNYPLAYNDGNVTRQYKFLPKGQAQLRIPDEVQRAVTRFQEKYRLDIRP